MKRSIRILFGVMLSLFLLMSVLPSFPVAAQSQDVNVIYMSPEGNDLFEGSIEKPVKTFEKAAEIGKKTGMETKVILLDGIYRVPETIIFNKASDIKFIAQNKGKVKVTAAVKLDGAAFEKVSDVKTLSLMPSQAHGKVYVTDLKKQGINDYGSMVRVERHKMQTPSSSLLLVDNKMMTIAEWPNKAFTKIKNTGSTDIGYKFEIEENRPLRWKGAKELYAYGNFNFEWADETFTIINMNPENSYFETNATTVHGISEGGEVRFINLIEELDIPGEWYLDRTEGKLYMYPFNEPDESEIDLVTTQNPIFELNETNDVSFENILFEGTCGTGIVLNNSNNNSVLNCEFQNIGQQAIIIKNGAGNVIDNNYIHDLGKGGIVISGGDKKNLTSSRNMITNNHIERFALIGKRYCDAVKLNGVGDIVSHNRIHNTPHYVITFYGNDNIIEYNDIYDALEETSDAGALYCGRSWVYGGNEIRYNYIHNFKVSGKSGRSAVYCDDYMAGVKIYGNLFANLTTGVTMHSAQYTTVKNNLFNNIGNRSVYLNNIDNSSDDEVRQHSKKALDMINSGKLAENYLSLYPNSKEMFEGYLFKDYTADNEAYNKKYPYITEVLKGDYILAPRYNIVENNVSYGGKIEIASGIAKETGSFENNFIASLDESPFADNIYTPAEKAEAEKHFDMGTFEDFEFPDISKIGIEGEESDTLKPFLLIAPVNGATDVDASDVVLCWEDYSGADKYRLTVARDKDFNDIVYDDIQHATYKRFRNLKFGQKTYYWKVQAIATSPLYKENSTRMNEGGVHSFTTAAKEDTALAQEKLQSVLDNACEVYGTNAESDNSNEIQLGAHKVFARTISEAQNVLKNSANATNKNLIRTTTELSDATVIFENSRNPVFINVSELMNDNAQWNGNAKFENGEISFDKDGSGGYNGDKLKSNHIVKMKAVFSISPGGYTSIGLRSAANTIEPWNTREYIFLVKENVIELQRFNGKKRFFFEVPNKYIKDSVPCEIEFGAVIEGEGIRITLSVDGKEVYNYLDIEDNVMMPGKLHVYNNGGSMVKLYPTETSMPQLTSGNQKIIPDLPEIKISENETDAERKGFSDLDENHWANEAIFALYKKGVVSGKTEDMFFPEDKITREEFVKLLCIAFEIPVSDSKTDFIDTDINAWYSKYINGAVNGGYVKGISKDIFGLGQNISRADMATLIYRVMTSDPLLEIYNAGYEAEYSDSELIPSYAEAAVEMLAKAGIISGQGDGSFAPSGLATRAEAAQLIYNAVYR